MKRDWANLEALPLDLVLNNLEERIDHVWFGAVCKNWRSIAKINHQNQEFRINKLPMLMILPQANRNSKLHRLYGISSDKVYDNFQLYFPNLKAEFRFCGSSHGWVAIDEYAAERSITLFNPFKDIAPITLPPLKSKARKVTLSVDPIKSPNNYVVAAIYGLFDNIALIRADQRYWNYELERNYHNFVDVIFYKGLVYATTCSGKIVSFDLCNYLDDSYDGNKRLTLNIVSEVSSGKPSMRYFVKSLREELWMVNTSYGHSLGRIYCDVYKLELDVKSGKLQNMLKLESLEDNILFIGLSDSISVSASYFSKCLQKDSIYFDDEPCFYNVKSRKNYPCQFAKLYKRNDCFWIQPYFRWD